MIQISLTKLLQCMIVISLAAISLLAIQPYELAKLVTPSPNTPMNPTATPSADPKSTYDPATYGIPDTIAGYRVLAVKTLENTACMLPNTLQLILQASNPNVESFLENNRSDQVQAELAKLQLTRLVVRWETTFAGPALVWDWDKFISGNDEWNAQMKRHGCLKLGPPRYGNNGDEVPGTPGSNGFIIFENTDADSVSTDDSAQSVNLVPPASIGNNQDGGLALLNNVITDDRTIFSKMASRSKMEGQELYGQLQL